jgi:hypothetical protein
VPARTPRDCPPMRLHVDPTGAAPGTDHRWQIVVAGGALTSIATLVGVFALANHGTNIMGWYANWIIPIGAVVVGMCAASGYAIAAWFTGLKMTRRLVLGVLALLALSYMLAQYEEYRQLQLDDVGFFTWFDAVTRAFSFEERNGTPGSPFGLGGYFFRALELSGFALGGVLAPLVLRHKPHCERCRTYKRTHSVAWVAGGLADDAAVSTLDEMFGAAGIGDRAAFDRAVAKAPVASMREVNRHDLRVNVSIVRCPRCADGGLVATRYQGHGKHVQRSVAATLPLAGDRVRALFD